MPKTAHAFLVNNQLFLLKTHGHSTIIIAGVGLESRSIAFNKSYAASIPNIRHKASWTSIFIDSGKLYLKALPA